MTATYPPGSAVAVASGSAPDQRLRADLRRFKALLEAGEVPVVQEDVAARGPVGQRITARVIAIDRLPNRLDMAERYASAAPLNYADVNVGDALADITAGRGPDVCIEAVGMEAHGTGPQYVYDRAKQALRLHTDRGIALRQAIHTCRKGATVSVVGAFAGLLDKFLMGAVMNKGLTIRSGQQHGQRYIPMLLDRMAAGEIQTAHLTTHPMPLDDAVRGYHLFKTKEDGCVRAVFHPHD